MKPNFALNFTHTDLSLLHRTSNGWHVIGDVSLDDPNLDKQLAVLRSTATAIAASGLSTKLVLPNSQILYSKLEDQGTSTAKQRKAIEQSLIGATPYALDELVYDWTVTPQGLQIAVVAKETLDEAEGFAAQHGFNPLTFVALPEAGDFDGEPFFGRTKGCDALIGKRTKIEPDTVPIKVISPSHSRPSPAASAPLIEPERTPVADELPAPVTPSVAPQSVSPSAADSPDENKSDRPTLTTAVPTVPAPLHLDEPEIETSQPIVDADIATSDFLAAALVPELTNDEAEAALDAPEPRTNLTPELDSSKAKADMSGAVENSYEASENSASVSQQKPTDSTVDPTGTPSQDAAPSQQETQQNHIVAGDTSLANDGETPSVSAQSDSETTPNAFQSLRASRGTAQDDNADSAAAWLSKMPSRVLTATPPAASAATVKSPVAVSSLNKTPAPETPASPKSADQRVTARQIPVPDLSDQPPKAPSIPDPKGAQPRAANAINPAPATSMSAEKSAKKSAAAAKAAPLPEPPAMPAPLAAKRRVDTLEHSEAPAETVRIVAAKSGETPASITAPASPANLDEKSTLLKAVAAPKPETQSETTKTANTPVKTDTSIGKSVLAAAAAGGSTAIAALKTLKRRKSAKPEQTPVVQPSGDAPFVDMTEDESTSPQPLSESAAGLIVHDDQTTDPQTDIFGARKKPAKKRKLPLGLVLTLVLIVFLGLVAAWASLSTPDSTQDLDTTQTSDAPEDTATQAVDAAIAEVESEIAADEDTAIDDESVLAFENDQINIEDITRQYVATGVWTLAPETGLGASEDSLDDLYIASIDPNILSQDAVALPPALPQNLDATPAPTARPAPAGTTYEFDDRGLVRATADGAITPSGVLVFAGRPSTIPALRPVDEDTETAQVDAAETVDPIRAALTGFVPRLRPSGLAESNELAQFGGLTRAELGGFRPRLRPQSAQQEAQAIAEAEGAEAPAATAPIVTVSLTPKPRPLNSAKLAAAARAAQAAVQQATGETSNNSAAERVTASVPAPSIPTGRTATTVAQAATVKNAINLRRVNLMGVYGSSSDRRALVRLSSGRLAKVKVGDKVDGGRVQSIANSSLTYVKGGRSVTLNVGS
ncbi:hypothetical protein EDD53_1096 [Pacificibacter maritimus]|uniref:Type IV pilus biogenesis protein PilP n=1 Tax=Pacificibacter maritimus TaxID=762213 RepID=A0A3N4UWM8_9RHOB|nr:hypothetical protein [Pacificibacter maritimus]RPE71961.1 hypothetical protein EDD53_1096 [Pacificibacter maritimus]